MHVPLVRPRPYFKKLPRKPTTHAATTPNPWAVPALCQAYNWPTNLVGGGVIAIVELGGGWTVPDMMAYFGSINQPMPSITDVSVDGTTNTPGEEADGEVALDIQVAAAAYFVATGKAATIRVYWVNDIVFGVQAAANDGCDVCSISWGSDEANWGAEACQDMDAAAAAATAAGMIVFAASGDNDSSDGGSTPANVDCPASCPNIIGCGGTFKTSSSEVVWNNEPGQANGSGSGGGYSTVFPIPDWQAKNAAPAGPGRMVPDVAADADPNSGYQIFFGGQAQIVGGTSAVAPLYAGLFAALGTKLGSINAKLWANRACFADITQGDNGMYRATTGPDPCTGLGVPIGNALATLFAATVAEAPATQAVAQPPVVLDPQTVIAWACSQLPSMFMTKGTVEQHVRAGLTKNWPKHSITPTGAVQLMSEHYRLLAEIHRLGSDLVQASQRESDLLVSQHLDRQALSEVFAREQTLLTELANVEKHYQQALDTALTEAKAEAQHTYEVAIAAHDDKINELNVLLAASQRAHADAEEACHRLEQSLDASLPSLGQLIEDLPPSIEPEPEPLPDPPNPGDNSDPTT